MSANCLSDSPFESAAQTMELSWSSERLALLDSKEDWTGLSNPAARRKLQNRINQRARRERARGKSSRDTLEKATAGPGQSTGSRASSETEQEPTANIIKRTQRQGCISGQPEVQALMNRFADHAYTSYLQGEPTVAHLPLLVRYNVATALERNATRLGVVKEFYDWEGISPMNKQGPLLGLAFHDHFQDWPTNMQPTQLQIAVNHHPWVDCFPWPRMRDNLLLAFEHPDICDEDELCHDICDYEDPGREPMLLIWGSPWDPRSWEVSEAFLKKWAWLLFGCGDVIIATNYWRAKRGEPIITPHQFTTLMRLSLPKSLNLLGT